MRVVRDLIGGSLPPPIDIHYNGSLAADSVTLRYVGSLVKIMDIDDVDNGYFFTWGGATTALENIAGILEEQQPVTGNELPNTATNGMTTRKMTPIFPSTIVRGEYVRLDAAGTDSTDTNASGSAASTTFTANTTGTADYNIGGWIYMVDGSNASYLHYVTDDDGSGVITLSTALVNAVASSDTFLFIQPSMSRTQTFDATYTGLKSEIDDSAGVKATQGIMHYIQAPGVAFQRLSVAKHDGLFIPNAKFYHDFVFTGGGDVAGSTPNLIWTRGTAAG